MAIHNETIWLTGATSGIGLALAKQLAEQGNQVIISGRNQEALTDLERTYSNMVALPFDVTNTQSVAATREQLNTITTRLDRVILNAGTCEYFEVNKPDWSLFKRVMDTNYIGMVNSIDVCFELLKNTPNSHLIGIASQTIFSPFIRAEAYGASKAAVSYMLDSLRLDVKEFGIDVSLIYPGFVETSLTAKNDFKMPFLLTAEQASARIIKASHRRVRHYSFPKRLRLALSINSLRISLLKL